MVVRGLLVIALLVTSCGEGAMTPDEYFEALEAVRADFTRANDDLDDRYTEQLGTSFSELQRQYDMTDPAQVVEFTARSVEVSISATVALLTARMDGLERYLAGLETLRPPPRAAEAHAASLAALRDAREGLDPTVEAVEAVETVGGLGETVRASPIGQALLRAGEACRALQGLALGDGLIVDLQCPEP